MAFGPFDLSARGKQRVYVLTAVGTLFCIVAAFAIDSYSFETGVWRFSAGAINNLIIPLVIAPPFFWLLLSKLRELSIAHAELLDVASTDPLTSCLNRRAFTALVDGYLQRVEQQEAPRAGALLVLDVDHFKAVNDNFGHPTGDALLKMVAGRLSNVLREGDTAARLGGDEFVILQININEPSEAAVLARRIVREISAPYRVDGRELHIGASVGIALAPQDGVDLDHLAARADEALYQAKTTKRGTIGFWAPPRPLAQGAA